MNEVYVNTGPTTWKGTLLVAALLPWLLLANPDPSSAATGLWIEKGSTPAAPSGLLQFSEALSALVERLRPSVVQIGLTDARELSRELPPDHPPIPDERPRVGSGFIIHPDGYVITNQHVVSRSNKVEVELFGGEKVPATVVGIDARTDLALLKISPPRGLSALPLGDSDALKVGELVLAIGNPFGLDYSVTMGVVSRKGRAFGVSGPYDEFIQTDAAINPGNSGGPLLNLKGEVVGISNATVPNRRVGFAIPINLAKSFLPELKERGRIRWGFLGVSIQEVTAPLAQAFGIEGTKGALVNGVLAGQPAEKAGLKPGDIIVGVDGVPIADVRDLQRRVGRTEIGKTLVAKIIRKGREEEVSIRVGENPEQAAAPAEASKRDLGLTVEMLGPRKAKELKIREEQGLVVTEVVKHGPASQAGIRVGDMVKELNHQPVSSVEEYVRAVGESVKKELDLFLIKRGDSAIYVAVRSKG